MKYVILKLFSIVSLFMIVIKPVAQVRTDSLYVRFLTGVFLLNGATALQEDEKAEKYLELVEITGISADTAVKYLSTMRQRPQDWIKLQEKIDTELSIQLDSLKKIPTNNTKE